MKIILLENVRKVGSIGEIIDVKRGFARNYLIAQKKALFASKENIKEVDNQKIAKLANELKIKNEKENIKNKKKEEQLAKIKAKKEKEAKRKLEAEKRKQEAEKKRLAIKKN